MASFFTRTQISSSSGGAADGPSRPPPSPPPPSTERSDITFWFARAELQACLQFLPLSLSPLSFSLLDVLDVWDAVWAPIPLFYPHNAMMHLRRRPWQGRVG